MPMFNLTIATPADAADTTIFDTTVNLGGARMLPLSGIKRISFTVKNDQAATLKAYESANGGTTWDQYQAITVAIPGASATSGPYDFLVDTFQDWKLVWTNGGVTQTVFRYVVSFNEDTRQPGL